ncbi:hypothetical protein DFP72DRAFT_824552 [Ephemerocybe angulata]|uniref:Reverse transcriptase zinc-binding domain-containing protein n=1 Tax=Ephemerocybe angulata TaxID=980116 RepID=A0A8H6HE75_9AGAR|nr:hypothetical protein DFP72DRAFT_824552 [Tulosesus angulatus]
MDVKEKWNPTATEHDLDEILDTTNHIRAHLNLPRSEYLFEGALSDYGDIENGFRAFLPTTAWADAPLRVSPNNTLHEPFTRVDLHTATALLPDHNTAAGFSITFGDSPERNTTGRTPAGAPVTQDYSTLTALCRLMRITDTSENLRIGIRSKSVIHSLTTRLQTLEDTNWTGTPYGDILRPLVALLRTRRGLTIFSEQERPRGPDNQQALVAAREAASDQTCPPECVPQPPASQVITGAKLAKLTQAQIYRLMLNFSNEKQKARPSTVRVLNETKLSARARLKAEVTSEEIWKSIRGTNIIQKKVRAFLWKLLHDALPCGKSWGDDPVYVARADCPACSKTESAKHILTECRATGQGRIWELTKALLAQAGITWDIPKCVGDILTCGIPSKVDSLEPGQQRLLTITVSESAWLIWTSRCKWIIEGEGKRENEITANEATNKWNTMIDSKLNFDIMASNRERYDAKAVKEELVLETWSTVIDKKDKLMQSLKCHRNTGVLAGRGLAVRRPPGRNR